MQTADEHEMSSNAINNTKLVPLGLQFPAPVTPHRCSTPVVAGTR